MQLLKHILVYVLLFISLQGHAIIFRHDVSQSAFIELAKRAEFDCVGRVYLVKGDSNQLGGSCVLIDRQYVLSAKHVFNADLPKQDYKVEFNGVFYDIFNSISTLGDDHDLITLQLVQEVKGVIPATITHDALVVPGDTVTMVGYGGLRPSDMLSGNLGVGIKAAGQNVIDSICGPLINEHPSRLYADFDGPMFEDKHPLALEGMLNGGDSGGALFVYKKGRCYLAGIAKGTRMQLSSTTGFDGSTMHWSSMSGYYSWISYAMADLEKPGTKNPSR